MPLGRCEVHGLQWFAEMCPHLRTAAEQAEPAAVHSVSSSLLCSDCIETFGIETGDSTPTHRGWTLLDTAFEGYDAFNRTSVLFCHACYTEYELNTWRTRGLDDPFHAYESTPTSQKLADRLAEGLLAALPFHVFQDCSGSSTHALDVFKGELICPLRVVVDFVEERSMQDSILSWIEEFFHDARETQREVWFYRSFEVREYPGGCRQGHAGLLRMEESHPAPPGLAKHAWYGPPRPLFEKR